MKSEIKKEKYKTIKTQLDKLFKETTDPFARIASTIALLHKKFDYYFWTGFYRLVNGELTVASYQGSLACLVLEKDKGVCWAGINRGETVIVPDVEQFPGHIECDSRSRSEIVVPVRNSQNEIIGVFDVDSRKLNAFNNIDKENLEDIISRIYN